MRRDLLRRLERLEKRLRGCSEMPAFVIETLADWKDEIAWGAAEPAQPESESGPQGFSRGWQRNTAGVMEEGGNIELLTARQRRMTTPPYLVVQLVLAQGRESLACGERIVRDWSHDNHGNFRARERITSDPADHGLLGAPGGRLDNDIREVEERFEREAKSYGKDASETQEG
jgi:hypothetical protein